MHRIDIFVSFSRPKLHRVPLLFQGCKCLCIAFHSLTLVIIDGTGLDCHCVLFPLPPSFNPHAMLIPSKHCTHTFLQGPSRSCAYWIVKVFPPAQRTHLSNPYPCSIHSLHRIHNAFMVHTTTRPHRLSFNLATGKTYKFSIYHCGQT